MEFSKLTAEILGFSATGIGFFIAQQKSRSRILLIKFICDVLWVTHFALIGAFSGMAISLIGCLREIVFAKNGESKKNNATYLLFVSIGIGATLIAWESAWSTFSLISTVLSTTAYWQRNPNKIKGLLFIVALSQMTYAIASASYAAIFNETLVIISTLIFFGRYLYEKRKAKAGVTSEA